MTSPVSGRNPVGDFENKHKQDTIKYMFFIYVVLLFRFCDNLRTASKLANRLNANNLIAV